MHYKVTTPSEKSVRICFVRGEKGKYIHDIEIVNPLKYGNINFNFILWSARKAIKHFIGFLDYSKGVDFVICETICGIALYHGKVYTNKEGKIKFTL